MIPYGCAALRTKTYIPAVWCRAARCIRMAACRPANMCRLTASRVRGNGARRTACLDGTTMARFCMSGWPVAYAAAAARGRPERLAAGGAERARTAGWISGRHFMFYCALAGYTDGVQRFMI